MRNRWITVSCNLGWVALIGTIAPQVMAQSTPCRGQLVNNQCVPLRSTFFEEERRLRFGFTNFLDAALDGAGNAINTNVRNPETFATVLEASRGGPLPGTLVVGSRDRNDPNFLASTFTADSVGTVTITRVSPDSNEQTGNVDLQLRSINGQSLDIVNGRYRASGAANNDRVSGVIEVTDPTNPERAVFIQLPPNTSPNASDNNQTISGRATVSVGRPVDR
ncbi:hypothetical protein H6F89_28295 [Cyanobacteria bacterium FACHB-63]|nr:hypothetical protein [Cyanobacteria bacterium FACHB-63]